MSFFSFSFLIDASDEKKKHALAKVLRGKYQYRLCRQRPICTKAAARSSKQNDLPEDEKGEDVRVKKKGMQLSTLEI